MQKYVHNLDSSDIRYYDEGIDVSEYIDINLYRLMTEIEIDQHENRDKYLTKDERLSLIREGMPDLTPIQFDLKLRKNGLLQDVRDYVETDEVMNIAYNRATFFCRTDPFIETARVALNLTNEQIDSMWLSD